MPHMQTRTRKEVVFGHSIIHAWRKHNWARKPMNWTKEQIRKEHARLVKIMKKMGILHNTPIH